MLKKHQDGVYIFWIGNVIHKIKDIRSITASIIVFDSRKMVFSLQIKIWLLSSPEIPVITMNGAACTISEFSETSDFRSTSHVYRQKY